MQVIFRLISALLLVGECFLLTFVSGRETPDAIRFGGKGYPLRRDNETDEFPMTRSADSTTAGYGQFPYQLYIKRYYATRWAHKCGATLVEVYGIQIAISAAHCFWLGHPYRMSTVATNEMQVIAGDWRTTDLDGNEHFRNIDKVLLYPDYDPQYKTHDIAIIFLEKDFPSTKYVDPLILPGYDWPTPSLVRISGWGNVAHWKRGPDTVLNYVDLPSYSTEKCMGFNKYPWLEITDHMFCVGEWGQKKPKGPCKGDQGGPAVGYHGADTELYFMGIFSFTASCDCGHPYAPSVFTKVSKYVDWIRIEVNKYRDEKNI